MENAEISSLKVNRYLEEWEQIADKYRHSGLRGGQEFIEPYLLQRMIYDRIGHIIIATREGRDWYDNHNSTELPHLLRLGMIRQGDTVFDCGSNQGINSLFYSQAIGTNGRVIAFDPFALNCDIGRFNAYLNDAGNIDFIRLGLSDKAGSLVVAAAEQCVGMENELAIDSVRVNLVPLDVFASMRPGFIKIDIEGAEVNALEGAHEVLAQEPALYIEVHPGFLPRFNRSSADIFEHVKLDCYTCFIDHPGVPMFSEYRGEFEMTQGCALYCVPKSRTALMRRFKI